MSGRGPKERGPEIVTLLQNMELPKIDGDPLVDEIINKCWHKYTAVTELAAYTATMKGT
jgi:hypothetical protein